MPVGMRSYQGRSLMIYIKDVSLVIHSRYFLFSSENLLEEGQTDVLKEHISQTNGEKHVILTKTSRNVFIVGPVINEFVHPG